MCSYLNLDYFFIRDIILISTKTFWKNITTSRISLLQNSDLIMQISKGLRIPKQYLLGILELYFCEFKNIDES